MNDFCNVDELLLKAIKSEYFPCAVAAVGSKNKVYKTFCYGNRCLVPEKLPVEENTLFDMASLTKVIATNTLCMIFIDRGLISLDDKISKYIERYNKSDKANLTIRQLLTHTTGLEEFLPFHKLCKNYEDAIDYIMHTNYKITPNTNVLYSDLNYILLGYILEKIGHNRLDSLCEEHIFRQLNMKSTCFNPTIKLNGNITYAATEINEDTGLPFTGVVHDENARFFDGISGHAGLFSNINDVIIFVNMLMNCGNFNGRQLISQKMFNQMITNQTKGLNKNRGLGWIVEGKRCFSHTGFTGTSVYVDLEKNIYAILLTNRVHPSRNNTKILQFRKEFYNAVLSNIYN